MAIELIVKDKTPFKNNSALNDALMLHWVIYQLVHLFAGVDHKEGHHSMLKPDIKPTDVELIVNESGSSSHDCDSSGSKITDCIALSSMNILPGQLRVCFHELLDSVLVQYHFIEIHLYYGDADQVRFLLFV